MTSSTVKISLFFNLIFRENTFKLKYLLAHASTHLGICSSVKDLFVYSQSKKNYFKIDK